MQFVDRLFERRLELFGGDTLQGVRRTGLPDDQRGLFVSQQFGKRLRHVLGGLPRLDERYNFHGHVGQPLAQGRFELGRIGQLLPVRAGQRRGGGSGNHNGEDARLYGVRHMRQAGLGMDQMLRDRAGIFGIAGCCADAAKNHEQRPDNSPHVSPPARSGRGGFGRVPLSRPSIVLYHEISEATPIMARIPNPLINICIPTDREISDVTKCPRNERKIPKQKISSECWPHRIIGRSKRDLSPGQSGGMKRMVMTASAMKCTKRKTSMLVLSIGYIQSWNHLGITTAQRGKYQVMTTRNANSR